MRFNLILLEGNMLICLECHKKFYEDELECYMEKHGLDSPPYEKFYACPYCAGMYDSVMEE